MPAFYPEEKPAPPLEHYLQVLLHRKWLLAAVAVTIVVLAALQVFTTTPMYRASATLQVDPEGSKVVPFQEVAGSEMAGGWFMENYLWTQTEVLRSHSLALRVVRKLDLGENESFAAPIHPGLVRQAIGKLRALARLPLELIAGPTQTVEEPNPEEIEADLASMLAGGVQAQPIRNTRLIEVSYISPDPALAAVVVNTLNEEFIELQLQGKYDATMRATEFLRGQLEELQVEVEKSEQALLDYAQRHNIVNLSERETIARKRLADLSDELTLAETELIDQRARHEAARSASADELPESLKNEGILRLERRLSEARGELASFSSRYGSEWPEVKETRLEIEDLQKQLAEEKRRALASARQDHELARDRHSRLEAAVARQRQLVDDLNERSIQYNILKREVDSNKELYEGLLQRLKEAGVAAGLRSSNIRVADKAERPKSRATPRMSRSLLMALVLGLLLGTAVAFLIEALDYSLKGTDDVTQHLGLPALGTVPSLVSGERRRQSRRWPFLKTAASRQPHLIHGQATALEGRAVEAYRSLRTALLLSHSGTPPQVILVTSAVPGEGKSTTVANMGIALAQTGARTVIVDLDMRKPSLAKAFGIAAEQGMSTFLSGNSDLSSQIHETGISDLFLVPAGPKAPNPVELIGSARMATGMQLMREYFSYVIFDTPPALELSDALAMSPHVDGVILVARGGKTPRRAIRKAAELLLRVGAKLLGVLVNDVSMEHTGYGYYGYYGYYSSAAKYYGRYHSSDSDDSQQTA